MSPAFAALRTVAAWNGYEALSLDAPYVSDGERWLLYYLSELQKEKGVLKLRHVPLELTVQLSFCAGMLAGAGAALPFRRVPLGPGPGEAFHPIQIAPTPIRMVIGRQRVHTRRHSETGGAEL
ncbi:hypothetical protein J2X24_003007 [Asticcacaulis solisilvae]|nr:hypothetical protein [Asticcacaulis solisilvae]MBP2160429.1 hypothetical protein [Asticcacaulis solisilvae]